MSVEVVFILGPGAAKLAATLATATGPEWRFVANDDMPGALPAELPAAIVLMQDELKATPLIQTIAVMEPVCHRPGIIVADSVALTSAVEVSAAVEKSWIRHSLVQFEELGGPSFTEEMLDLFYDQVDQFLGKLELSLQSGDAPTVRRILHTLKSTLANYGGRRLRPAAQMLEHEAANGNLDAVREHANNFGVGVRRFRDLLQATAAEFSSTPAGR